jgi:membrane protease YdiL (CAAX protease family)
MIAENNKFHNRPILAVLLVINLYSIYLLISIDINDELSKLDVSHSQYLVIWTGFFMIYMATLFLFICAYILHLPDGQRSMRDYFVTIKLNRSNLAQNFFIAIASCIIFSIFTLIGALLAQDYNFDLHRIYGSPDSDSNGGFTWLTNLIPAIWEEIAFRGIILTLLLKRFNVKKAILFDSILFGVFHIWNAYIGRDVDITIYQILVTSFISLIFAFMLIKSENLLTPILFHFLSNIVVGLFHRTTFPGIGPDLAIYFLISTVIPTILCLYFIEWYFTYKKSPRSEKLLDQENTIQQ